MFEKDAVRIKELSRHVDDVNLWGGESLLHPDLAEMLRIAREVFPDSLLAVGTNGLLIPSLPDSFFNTMNECKARVIISGYPPTLKNWDKIEAKLIQNNIPYKLVSISNFYKRIDLNGDNYNSYDTCFSRICHMVSCGEIAGCYMPVSLKIFNKFFKKEIDTDSSLLNLHNNDLSCEKLSTFLKSPMDVCKYCGEISLHPWTICNKSSTKIEDWANNV